MEVHPHTHTERKKWHHYFWEFFMLFLAVTLGFFVENQREHYAEKQRALQYAISLIEDLKADTIELNGAITQTRYYALSADTLLTELDKPASLQNDSMLQIHTSHLTGFSFYDPQMETYNQIKNSGSLRYFPIDVIKKLNHYEAYANYILKLTNQQLDFRIQQLVPLVYKIQNVHFIRSLNNEIRYTGPVFIEMPDKKLGAEWYNYAYYFKRIYNLIANRMEVQLRNALDLITLLEKKYDSH